MEKVQNMFFFFSWVFCKGDGVVASLFVQLPSPGSTSLFQCPDNPIWWSYQQSRMGEGIPEYFKYSWGTFGLDVAAQFAFLYCSLVTVLNLDVVQAIKACQPLITQGLDNDHLPSNIQTFLAFRLTTEGK